jgi:hypothetical protein
LGYKNFYVVEAIRKTGPTFIEEYTNNVYYALCNNPNLRNNGINEAKTLLEGCSHFNFDPDDIIIKLTGRHSLISNHLIKTVEENTSADVFVKTDINGNTYTSGFAMRYKYFKEMFETINYDYLEKQMISIEYEVNNYIKNKMAQNSIKVIYLKKLDIKINEYGSSTAPGAHGIYTH